MLDSIWKKNRFLMVLKFTFATRIFSLKHFKAVDCQPYFLEPINGFGYPSKKNWTFSKRVCKTTKTLCQESQRPYDTFPYVSLMKVGNCQRVSRTRYIYIYIMYMSVHIGPFITCMGSKEVFLTSFVNYPQGYMLRKSNF